MAVGSLDRFITREAKNAQRRALGLPEAADGPPQFLEIQAYDELCFPGLAAQWGPLAGQRPFVGYLTLELPTDADDEVVEWIGEGTPPVYFGFGSTPVTTFADTVTMIGAVCGELGERALILGGPNEVAEIAHGDHVKVVGAVNHSTVFPLCRAVVHHGGAGTTTAGLRAGIPALILWSWVDQPYWGAAIEQLGVGVGRCFSSITPQSLLDDLRFVLAPERAARAREIAEHITAPGQSATATADLLEETARAV